MPPTQELRSTQSFVSHRRDCDILMIQCSIGRRAFSPWYPCSRWLRCSMRTPNNQDAIHSLRTRRREPVLGLLHKTTRLTHVCWFEHGFSHTYLRPLHRIVYSTRSICKQGQHIAYITCDSSSRLLREAPKSLLVSQSHPFLSCQLLEKLQPSLHNLPLHFLALPRHQ